MVGNKHSADKRHMHLRRLLLATLVCFLFVGLSGIVVARQQQPIAHHSTINIPSHRGETVLYVRVPSDLYALRASDRSIIWQAQLPYGLGQPTVADGTVYAAADKLYAFNALTGALIWKTSLNNQSAVYTVVVNGIVYVASANGSKNIGVRVYALRVRDGSTIWHYTTTLDDQLWSAPVIAANSVYLSTDDIGCMRLVIIHVISKEHALIYN